MQKFADAVKQVPRTDSYAKPAGRLRRTVTLENSWLYECWPLCVYARPRATLKVCFSADSPQSSLTIFGQTQLPWQNEVDAIEGRQERRQLVVPAEAGCDSVAERMLGGFC
jgi:hypothetical protein